MIDTTHVARPVVRLFERATSKGERSSDQLSTFLVNGVLTSGKVAPELLLRRLLGVNHL
jgi:hypothetical protein